MVLLILNIIRKLVNKYVNSAYKFGLKLQQQFHNLTSSSPVRSPTTSHGFPRTANNFITDFKFFGWLYVMKECKIFYFYYNKENYLLFKPDSKTFNSVLYNNI